MSRLDAILDFNKNYTFDWGGGKLAPFDDHKNDNGVLFLAFFQCLKFAQELGGDNHDREIAEKAIASTITHEGSTKRAPDDPRTDSHDNHNGRAMLCLLHGLEGEADRWLSYGEPRHFVFDNEEHNSFLDYLRKAIKQKDFEAWQQPSTVFLFDLASSSKQPSAFRTLYMAAAFMITDWHFMTWAMTVAIKHQDKLRGWRKYVIGIAMEIYLRKIRKAGTLRQLLDGYFIHPNNPYVALADFVDI